MTGHFTTADGCERWGYIVGPVGESYRVPILYRTPRDESRPFSTPRDTYAYRMYKLESVDYTEGLAHYVEVYTG